MCFSKDCKLISNNLRISYTVLYGFPILQHCDSSVYSGNKTGENKIVILARKLIIVKPPPFGLS